MKPGTIILITVLFLSGLCSAGWVNTISKTGTNRICGGYETIATHFLAGVNHYSEDRDTSLAWIFFYDTLGNVITLIDYGGQPCYLNSVMRADDINFVVFGERYLEMATIYMAKIDPFGNILWDRDIPIATDFYLDKVFRLHDENFIIMGEIPDSANRALYISKIDSSGETIWENTYRILDAPYVYPKDGIPTSNGFIATVYWYSEGTDTTWGRMFRFDSEGEIIDTLDTLTSVWRDLYKNFRILCPSHNEHNFFVYEFSYDFSDSIFEWSYTERDTTGAIIRTLEPEPQFFTPNHMKRIESGYICTGSIQNPIRWDYELAIMKIDYDWNIQWINYLGDSGYDETGQFISSTSNGGYFLMGYRYPPGAYRPDAIVIAKVDSMGSTEISEEFDMVPSTFRISVSPNPFNSSVKITVPAGAEVEIYDIRGNVVTPYSDGKPSSFVPLDKGDRNRASVKVSGGSWTNERSAGGASRGFVWQPTQSIPSGIYIVKATMENGNCITKHIVYLK